MVRFTHIILTTALLAVSLPTCGRTFGKLTHFVDSMLTARYQRADIDTNYIVRPQTKWTLVGRLNLSGAELQSKGLADGRHFSSEMKADMKTSLSIGVSYLGLSLNLSFNPVKLMGKYHNYELNFRSYGKRLGFDIAYHDARNFKGWYEMEVAQPGNKASESMMERTSLPNDLVRLRTLNANGYYIFNHRRFSYPAAFAHSYIQRRSAGSFMLAVSGQGQYSETQMEKLHEQGQLMKLKMTNIGVGAGYGYNYVPATGWLLHISALPTFIVYSNTSLTMGDTEIPLNYHFPEVIITGRGAVVKQIGRNKFAGLSMVFNFTNIGNEEKLAIHHMKWLDRMYFGIRL